jgi:sulfate transport system ATP-binding protein
MSIILEHVTKIYGAEQVVSDLSLTIEPGELFVLLGASGSGKSTLLRMIAGLTATDRGSIYLNDRDVTHLPPQKRGVGFVFQNYSLFQHLTAAQNIAFGLDVKRMPRREKKQRVRELLDLIDLPDHGSRRPAQLSGGQQQRVALARALAPKPDVLLLDEPFGALDVNIRTQLRRKLRQIQQQLGITAILVTHDQEEAFELADRIGIIEQGELLEVGPPVQLYRHPKETFTANFIGQANWLSAQRNGRYVYVDHLQLPAPENTDHLSGQDVDLLIRPESVVVLPAGCDVQNPLGQGIVEQIEFAGTHERVTVRLENGTRIQAMVSLMDIHEYNIQHQTRVTVGLRDYHLLPCHE